MLKKVWVSKKFPIPALVIYKQINVCSHVFIKPGI